MAQEDRFANIFTAEVVMSAANILTFVELNFGISLRDRMAIVIDELRFWPTAAMVAEMTAGADQILMALTSSDQVTDITDLSDRRIFHFEHLIRVDLGVAATAVILELPIKDSFEPPMIILPTRVFLGLHSAGLANPGTLRFRMHYRTVKITQDDQIIEVLETFARST